MLTAKFLVGLAAMATLGAAEPIKTGPGTRYFAGPAPARYLKEGIVPLLLVDPARLNEMCGTVPVPGLTLYGCTRRTENGQPVIIMPLTAEPYNWFVLLHEWGHSQGWPGDHPL